MSWRNEWSTDFEKDLNELMQDDVTERAKEMHKQGKRLNEIWEYFEAHKHMQEYEEEQYQRDLENFEKHLERYWRE